MNILDSTILLVVESRNDIYSFFSQCLGLEVVASSAGAQDSHEQLRFRLHEHVEIEIIVDPALAAIANTADLPILSLSFSNEDFELLQIFIRDRLPYQEMVVYDTPFAEIIDLPNISGVRIQIRSI